MSRRRIILAAVLALTGCASQWKILGGPPECRVMCERWHLKFAGMVGVGNQDRTGEGATACVCLDPEMAQGAVAGAGGSSASLSAPIVAAAQAAAAAAQQQALQQRLRQQQR